MIRFTDFTPIPGTRKKRIVIGTVDLYRKQFQMAERPVTLGIQKHIEIRPVLCQKLRCLKAVKPQEPVRLIEAGVPAVAAARPEAPEGWNPR